MSPLSITTEAVTGEFTPAAIPSRYLSVEHRVYLKSQGIDPELAQAFTVNTQAALPDELQFHLKVHGEGILPGLVFEHVDIRGNVTHQLRPDTPPAEGGKYLFPRGAFNGPFIHRTQEHLVGKLDTVAVIEGTKQFRAAISVAVEDGSIGEILFIGIPGCTGGVKDGVYSNDWNELIRDRDLNDKDDKGVDTVLIFDGDVATKAAVHASAAKLRKHLEITSGGKVRVAEITGYGNTGLDDWLVAMPAERRSRALHGLLSKAEDKMPPRPSKTAAKGNSEADLPVMDFTTGVCKFPDTKLNGMIQTGRTILGAAVRIIRSFAEYNDLTEDANQTMRHDIEITTAISGQVTTHVVPNVTDRMLATPREWLNKLPGGIGSKLSVYSRDVEILDRAIRNASEQELIEVVERSGLITDKDGIIRFMDTAGALGPEDKVVDLRAKISESAMKRFVLEDPHSITEDEIGEAFQHLLAMWDICIDPTAYLLMLGQIIAAVHGMDPKGTYGSYGEPGSGKTTIADMGRSVLGARLEMANFEATPGAIGNLGAGVHNLPLFVDDFQDLTSGGVKAVEAANNGLKMMLRRGYGGSKYSKNRLNQNKDTGKWETQESDPASPFFSVTMERKAIPYGMKSGMERMLLAHVTRQNSFAVTSDADKAMDYSRSPLGARALGAVVLDVVRSANQMNSLTEWKDYMEGRRREFKEALNTNHKGLLEDPRSYELPATPVFGIFNLLDIMATHEAITWDEAEERKEQAEQLIMKAAREWQDGVTRKGGGLEGHLSKLSDAVTAGTYLLASDWKNAYDAKEARTRVLGWHATYRGEEVVVLIPTEAARVCGYGNDTNRLEIDLAKHLVTDAQGNKKPALPSKSAKSGKARLWALKLSIWENGAGEGFDPAEHPDGGIDNQEF